MTTHITRYVSSIVTEGVSISYSDVSHTRYRTEDIQPITLINLTIYSDYSGTAVERSNYCVLLDDAEIAPHLVTLTGSHGMCGLAYLGTAEDPPEWIRETLESLDSYYILDDDDHSRLEMELESEAWNDWGKKDFARALANMFDRVFPDHQTSVDLIAEDEQIFEIWRTGCDGLNVNGGSGYQIETGGGVHFYIDEWIASFERAIRGQTEWITSFERAIRGQTPQYFREWPGFVRDVEALTRLGMSEPVSE